MVVILDLRDGGFEWGVEGFAGGLHVPFMLITMVLLSASAKTWPRRPSFCQPKSSV